MKIKISKKVLTVSLIISSSLVANTVMAITAPAAGDMGYELYDVAVNDMLNGPFGFVVGLGTVIYSATQVLSNWKLGGLGILGGSGILQADSIVTTMGLLL